MFKIRGLSLVYCFILVLVSLLSPTYATLLTDPDGINISLFEDGSLDNKFGPPSFVTGWDPSITGNIIPVPMGSGTEMLVTINGSSIEISQFATSSFAPFAPGWEMMFADIDWVPPSEIVFASVIADTFPVPLSVSFTADSLTIKFDGSSTDSLSIEGLGWEALITFDVEPLIAVNAPTAGLLIMLSCGFLIVTRKTRL